MEIKSVKANSFNASTIPRMSHTIQMNKSNSSYSKQIKELLKRRKDDGEKNDYPIYFDKNEHGRLLNIRSIPNQSINPSAIATATKANIEITKPASFKIPSNKHKRFSNKALSIDTKDILIIPDTNTKSNTTTTTLKKRNKDILHPEDCLTNCNAFKTNSTSAPGIIATSDTNWNGNSNNNNTHSNRKNNYSHDKRSWKVMNTEIEFNNEIEKLQRRFDSSCYNRKLIRYKQYFNTNESPSDSSDKYIELSLNANLVTLEKIKTLFSQYKRRSHHIPKSKSGNWLSKMSPSLLYNRNNKYDFSKEKEAKIKSIVYPSNKL